MSLSDQDTKSRLIQANRLLTELGIFDEQGHVTVRSTEDPNTIYINEQRSPITTGLRDIITFDLTEDGYPETAPGEAPLHAQVYLAREDVNAVCHNHSPYATTVSSVGLEMRPVHHVGAVQVDPITNFEDYHDEGGVLITSEEEAREIAEALGDDRAIMLRGHGPVVAGGSLAEVVMSSIKLEYNARRLWQQAAIGEPWYLPETSVRNTLEFMYSEEGLQKSLDYYLNQL